MIIKKDIIHKLKIGLLVIVLTVSTISPTWLARAEEVDVGEIETTEEITPVSLESEIVEEFIEVMEPEIVEDEEPAPHTPSEEEAIGSEEASEVTDEYQDSSKESIDEGSLDSSSSDEEITDESQPEEDMTEETIILEVHRTIDDNTLFIQGTANPNHLVEIRDGAGNILGQGQSNVEGAFEIRLNRTLEAGQNVQLILYDSKEEKIIDSVSTTVQSRGLSLNEPITESCQAVSGMTSANRQVQLLDELGNLIASGLSDGAGYFQLDKNLNFEAESQYSVQVLDNQVVARSLDFTVTATEKNEEQLKGIDGEEVGEDPLILNPFALIDVGLVRVAQDAIIIDNPIITESTQQVYGHIEIDQSLISLELLGIEVDLLSLVVDLLVLLSGKNINLTIHTDGQKVYDATTTLSSTEDLTFSFDISEVNLVPGRSLLTFQPEGLVLGLNILISIPIEFDAKVLSVEDDRIAITSVPASIQFESSSINVHDEIILNRVGNNPLTVNVVDTSVLVNPQSEDWRLTVYATQPLTMNTPGDTANTLPSSLYFGGQMIEGSQNAYVAASRSDFIHLGGGNHSLTFPSSQDFYLQLIPFTQASAGDYHTTIEWNLVNAY